MTPSQPVDPAHAPSPALAPHMDGVMHGRLFPYDWRDHVVTPQLAATSLMATALIVLVIGAVVMFAIIHPTAAQPPPAAHVSTEQTPPLAQLAKRPVRPHVTEN